MAFIVTLTLGAAAAWGATAPGPGSLVPYPALQEPEEGGGPPATSFEAPPLCPEPLVCDPRWSPLELTAEGRVVFAHPTLEPLAEVLAADFAAVTGLKLAVEGIPARSGDIVLSLGFMPDLVRGNPEAFVIEVFDHVLIAGQTLDGAARATARFLQLVRPPEAAPGEGDGESADPNAPNVAGARIAVPALHIVDAPSIRWRVMEVAVGQDGPANDPVMLSANARSLVARAHLAGHNAVLLQGFTEDFPIGTSYDVGALFDEARRRRVELVNVRPHEGPERLRVVASRTELEQDPETDPLNWAKVAADLVDADAMLLCPHDPFPDGVTAAALGPDETTAAQRLTRLLHPIPPVGRPAGAPAMLGVLYGHRIAAGSDVFLPVGWRETPPNRGDTESPPHAAALAGEAWHGGMRVDSLRGTPELERVLAAVDAALRRAK